MSEGESAGHRRKKKPGIGDFAEDPWRKTMYMEIRLIAEEGRFAGEDEAEDIAEDGEAHRGTEYVVGQT